MLRLLTLAALCALAGCRFADEDNSLVVSVRAFPERASEHLEGTRSCHAVRVRDTPALRTFKSGRREMYDIQTVIGIVDICK
jgi:hypothetical protein